MKIKKIFMLTFMALFMAIMVGCTNTVQAGINVDIDNSTDTWEDISITKIPDGTLSDGGFHTDYVSDVWIYRERPKIIYGVEVEQTKVLNEFERFFDWKGNRVYCIESSLNISFAGAGDHELLNIWNATKGGYSEEVLKKLELIAYYGYGYNEKGYNHTSTDYEYATQMLLWRIPHENEGWIHEFLAYGTWDWQSAVTHEYDDEMDEILKLVDAHNVKPDLDASTEEYYVGVPFTITDKNGVLSEYKLKEKSDNISVQISGNKMTVTPNATGEATIQLIKESRKYNRPTTFYISTKLASNADDADDRKLTYQDLMMTGDYTPTIVNITFKVDGLKIQIEKELKSIDDNTGDASPRGAVYGIYRDINCTDLVTEVTIEDDGHSTKTGYIPYQTYYVKEIRASESTVLDKTVYTVDPSNASIDQDGDYTFNLKVSNFVKTSNLKIEKKLSETDYDSEINLSNVQFKATLITNPTKVYYSNVSGEDGICQINDIPYGEYMIEECQNPDEAYPIEPFKVNFTKDGETYNYTKIDPSKEMKIAVNKVLLDETVGKTDAKVSGAYFTVYTDENATEVYKDKDGNPVIIGPTDNTGYAISGTMRTGTYYLKETTFPEGINPDAKVPGEDVTFRDKIYVASYDNKNQGEDIVVISLEDIVNIPNLGRVQILKYENDPGTTDEYPAAGAVLRLTLDSSDGQVYYDATIDEHGYAEFKNKDLEEYDPYTIPYGSYTIKEIQESPSGEHSYFFVQAENVVISDDGQEEKRIFSDEPVPAWVRVVKKDKDTGKIVGLEGAEFRIWNVDESKWVEMLVTPSGEYISTFKTNEEGYFYTPQELYPGTYVIYETKAPEGYYLQDEWRLPENESDYGKKGGKEFKIDKFAMDLADDTQYPEGGIAVGELVYETDIVDEPLKVDLKIHKIGERFTDSTSSTVTYPVSDSEEKTEEKFSPNYKKVGVEGAVFRVYAAEDISTPDGIERHKNGEMIAEVTTGSDGYVTVEGLYPGEYKIVEYKTPKGLVTNKEIENVILENNDQYTKVVTVEEEIENPRQKLEITFNKIFEEVDYSNGEELNPKALFGVYTKEVIKNYKGEDIIPSNKLVDLIWTDEDGDVTSQVDLPEGTYYIKELYASYPYTINTETVDFVLKYTDDPNQEFVVVEGPDFTNDYESASITLVKLSATTMDNIILNGDKIDTTTLDEEVQAILDQIKGMTKEEIKEYFEKNEVKFVSGAKYGVYTDEECQNALRIKDEETGVFEEAVIVTDDTGLVELNNIPLGEYYLKEIEAPQGYELSDEIVKVKLDNTNKDTMVYQALIEEEVIEPFLIKTDIFTGELIPNCIFEIRDENDELLLRSITDEEGKGYIPVSMFEDGKTYTYTEVEAPDIYDLNKEPHEFVAKYDEEGNWDVEPVEVENIRKTREVIVRKLDAETGEPLKGCVFTIAMIDPETGEQKVNAKTGEPIYLVENVETDENGEYIIPEAPMGTYKFLEIKAPEGYELDEDLTGYTFTIDNNSPETIIFEVTNTGDIAVIAIASVAVICAVGIVFVIRRNRKQA